MAGLLLLPNLYHNNIFVKSVWYGNDWVTLTLAVPFLTVSLFFSLRRAAQAKLAFTLYNHAFYAFGSVLNHFFLLFVLLFTSALYALILGLMSPDVEALGQSFEPKTPAKTIGSYMFLWGILLTALWVWQSFSPWAGRFRSGSVQLARLCSS